MTGVYFDISLGSTHWSNVSNQPLDSFSALTTGTIVPLTSNAARSMESARVPIVSFICLPPITSPEAEEATTLSTLNADYSSAFWAVGGSSGLGQIG
jgi:hypothetical protein